MVECKNITVKLQNREIVKNVSFKAEKGEITVIIGKNGSGKTTLMRAVSSSVKYEGEILVNEKNIADFSQKEKSALISAMPQLLPQPPVTVNKLVSFGRHPYTGLSGILSDKDKNIVQECIAEAKIENIASSTVNRISGGERRKAFFAMMLAQKAPVMLLDEPTANLDGEYTRHITAMINKRKADFCTIIMVLHDINHALMIADKIIAMDMGEKVFEGTPADAMAEKIPERIFGLKKYVSVEGEVFYN